MLCRKEESMGGRIELRWREKRQGFASRGVKFEYKDCKVGKEGNIAERMWRKLEWEAIPAREIPYKPREADKARAALLDDRISKARI